MELSLSFCYILNIVFIEIRIIYNSHSFFLSRNVMLLLYNLMRTKLNSNKAINYSEISK